jgi:hypothetical protein
MRFLRCVAACAAFCVPAAKASTYSDIWYDRAQPGWGVSVVQQLETAFVTLYSYDAAGKPTWFVASEARITAYAEPGGWPVFDGTLYRTEGSYHAGPYDPAQQKLTPIGQLQLEVLDHDRMRVHYVVDGTSVVKEVRRYTFQQPIEAGNFAGQFRLRQVLGSQPVGTLEVQADIFMHLDSETHLAYLRADDAMGRQCEYRGPYELTGKLVRISGTYACSKGDQPAGTFEVTELEVTAHGFTGYLRTRAGSDSQFGRFGAIRF